MAEDLPTPRVLRIFLASPSDVSEERDALSRLVRDINDVLTFLAPERRLGLELVRYETHAYPDMGQPQDVINHQIPVDYDIFIGVMWRRAGTPTRENPSGTIEEFRRAYARRRQGSRPVIMFYFCDQAIPIPDESELAQLEEVVRFKAELSKLGLTWTYPTHTDFGEHLRGGLLRAIRDILREESAAPVSATRAVPARVADSARTTMLDLSAEYEETRRAMVAGGTRTRRMTALFSRMKSHAPAVIGLLDEFAHSESPGRRLAAIAILQMFSRAEYLPWLAERLDNPALEKPFVGYQAAVALLEAVRALPAEDAPKLREALATAKVLAQKLPDDPDRLQVLALAESELDQKYPH